MAKSELQDSPGMDAGRLPDMLPSKQCVFGSDGAPRESRFDTKRVTNNLRLQADARANVVLALISSQR